ncbi:hypothetical protein GCM10027568_04980 [Humibacter soli]
MTATKLTFGIYPLHVAGTPFGVADGPADDFDKISAALAELRGDRTLIPRTYLIYTPEWEDRMSANADLYARNGLLGDVVIGCGDWTAAADQELQIESWLEFIRRIIRTHGPVLSSVQITNEPNLTFMEGSKTYIYEALTRGVIAAKAEITELGLDVEVGFGSVPESPVSVPRFWDTLAQTADEDFRGAVDFVGHNFYVDVFDEVPVPVAELPGAVEANLSALHARLDDLGLASTVAIRVTENGWPTGVNPMTGRVRSPEDQGEVLEAIIGAISELRGTCNVSHYGLFGLRDADSSDSDLFHQYGILRDDYTPKPAYATFKRLIRESGR